MSVLSLLRFHDEAAAFEYLERMVWPNGTVCPHCGIIGGRVQSGRRSREAEQEESGRCDRYGLNKCGECRNQFTAKVGTVFEDAKLPLHKMLEAVHLRMSSKKGISSHQLSRILEIGKIRPGSSRIASAKPCARAILPRSAPGRSIKPSSGMTRTSGLLARRRAAATITSTRCWRSLTATRSPRLHGCGWPQGRRCAADPQGAGLADL